MTTLDNAKTQTEDIHEEDSARGAHSRFSNGSIQQRTFAAYRLTQIGGKKCVRQVGYAICIDHRSVGLQGCANEGYYQVVDSNTK